MEEDNVNIMDAEEDVDEQAQADVLEETETSETMIWKTNKFVLKIKTDKYRDEVSALTYESLLSYVRGHMKPLSKIQKAYQVLRGDVDRHAEKIVNAMQA